MESQEFLNKDVRVIIDRPMGSKHPTHGFIYPLNYGYVPEVIALPIVKGSKPYLQGIDDWVPKK